MSMNKNTDNPVCQANHRKLREYPSKMYSREQRTDLPYKIASKDVDKRAASINCMVSESRWLRPTREDERNEREGDDRED